MQVANDWLLRGFAFPAQTFKINAPPPQRAQKNDQLDRPMAQEIIAPAGLSFPCLVPQPRLAKTMVVSNAITTRPSHLPLLSWPELMAD